MKQSVYRLPHFGIISIFYAWLLAFIPGSLMNTGIRHGTRTAVTNAFDNSTVTYVEPKIDELLDDGSSTIYQIGTYLSSINVNASFHWK